MPRFDAVFFDSGGTLYKTAPGAQWRATRAARLAAALAAWGLRADPVALESQCAELEERLNRERGDCCYTFYDLLQQLAREQGLNLGPEALACVTDAYAGPRYRDWLFPGTADMLAQLNAAGVYVGLIANTAWPGWCMDRALDGVGLLKHFRARLYSGDLRLIKPDPRIFHEARRWAGLAPGQRLLYVGDSLANDVRGARSAGWSAAWRRPENPPPDHGADLVFTTWPELLDFALK